ncbi:MAG: gamma-glutamyl-gamma-aminobutyrate hydrolase family protein [Clostridia bacterium]|nr:gamma-glutamyl-gamma-aminobutyrate hydrolase family protein [Clostridia bacterium]
MNIATTLRACKIGAEDSPWRKRYFIMQDYLDMAKQYGVGLVAITTEHDIERICECCDGLIIPGSGTNINPAYYGGQAEENPDGVDEYALDAKLIEYFVQHGKPIFGVCGGFQALNVYFGGTLTNVPVPGSHSKERDSYHEIDIVPGSFVYDVFGKERATVNTYHGMMLDRVADCFEVVATSTEDGIIEAIECKEKHIYAAEWHPEQSFHTGDPIEHKFFENFLSCCREAAKKQN